MPKGKKLKNETTVGRDVTFYTDEEEKHWFITGRLKSQGETKNGNAIRIATSNGSKPTLAMVDGQTVKVNLNLTTIHPDE